MPCGKQSCLKNEKKKKKVRRERKSPRGVESTRGGGVGDHPKASQQIPLEYVD
jgi:hypothetical protein